jgi:phosphoribosyl-ATP pyrophosphohydrolase/phosphoribosyl-AMP cyclohydrolase/histidinol dehydrogenase
MFVTSTSWKDIAALGSLPLVTDVIINDFFDPNTAIPATLAAAILKSLNPTILDVTSCWINVSLNFSKLSSPADWISAAITALDTGATKVVIPVAFNGRSSSTTGNEQLVVSSVADLIDNVLSALPQDRVVLKLAFKDIESNPVDTIKQLNRSVGGYILSINSDNVSDLASFVKPLVAAAAGGIHRKLVLDLPKIPASYPLIKQLSEVDADLLIPHSNFALTTTTSTEDSSSKLNVGQAYAACLVTDRSDGLFPTVVVDEQHVALGLAYSSIESISETLRTGSGVYQSRTRGLWYKGLTSGATQAIKKISMDCDRDTLQFVVTQKDPGSVSDPSFFLLLLLPFLGLGSIFHAS